MSQRFEEKKEEEIDWVQILSQHDTDGDGFIDWTEWCELCKSKGIDNGNRDTFWKQLGGVVNDNNSRLKIQDIIKQRREPTV